MNLFDKESVRIRRLRGLVGIVTLGLLLTAGSAFAQDGGEAPGDATTAPKLPVLKIQAERGADARVDYPSLTQLGPWDDRNYSLTRADLEVLSPNEADARALIPAFYRVELRKRYPDLKTTGLHQYPHSAKARFRVEHGGYLVGDQLYRKSKRVGGEFQIDLSRPYMPNKDWVRKRLTGESRVAPGAETAIAIKPTDTQIVIAGSNGSGGQEMHYSSDGGSTWNSAGTLPQSCCDPTVAWSTDGSKAFTVTLNDFSNDVYESTNNGRTWTRIAQVGTGAVDKEYLHIDKHPTSPYKDHLYLTWHLNNDMMFAKSSNQGSTWTSPVQLSNNSQTGIGSDITSNRSGHVFYIWPSSDFSSGALWSRRSTDGGSTWDTAVKVTDTQGSFDFPIPAMDSRRVFIYTAAESDLSGGTYADSIYIAYTD